MGAIERAAPCRAAQVWCVLAKFGGGACIQRCRMPGLKRLALVALAIAVASSQEYEPPQQETAFDDEFHDVPPPIRPPVAAKRIIKNSDGEPVLEVPLNFNLNLTVLRHHAGEAAVGASAGAIAAFIARRIQSTALLLSVLGGVGTAAALHLKWVSPAQVCAHSIFSRSFKRTFLCTSLSQFETYANLLFHMIFFMINFKKACQDYRGRKSYTCRA